MEKHNPAATAAGPAVRGWTVRIVAAVSSAFIPVLVTSVTSLVEHGAGVRAGRRCPATTAEDSAAAAQRHGPLPAGEPVTEK
ncbi:hypothetical protein ACFWPQ_46055 [Streptomyces sp. NPDC058464]|uniref:hypothetical protein n=1 Tax=Streptomyces sp. NPDC058464 TaxID=3346511 RepID=UPI003665F5DA